MRKGKTCTILAPGANLTRVLAVGLGKPAEVTQKILEEAGGAIVANLSRETAVAVANDALTAQQAAEVALGAVLRSYRFDRYRTKEKPEDKPKLSKLTILTAEVPKAKAAWEPLRRHREGRVSDPRPGQRAAQRPRSARDGRTLPQACPNLA